MSTRHHPERSLGFLISDVARLLRRNFDRRLQALGLTQAQWRAIARLSRAPGMTQVALADSLEIQPITLARLVDRMESAGWVERRSHPLDRRAVQLYLTAKCEPILEELDRRAGETLADATLGLCAGAQRDLVAALLAIKNNLAAADSATSNAADSNGRNKDAGRKPTRLERAR